MNDENRKRPTRQQWEAARIEYETTPVRMSEIARRLGVSHEAVRKRRWKKLKDTRAISELAHRRADERAEPVGSSVPGSRRGIEEAVREAVAKAKIQAEMVAAEESVRRLTDAAVRQMDSITDIAVELRAQLLEKHRKELDAARAVIYEGLRKKDLDSLRAGKTAAESLKVLHDAERRAWGIGNDPEDPDGSGVQIVIERG